MALADSPGRDAAPGLAPAPEPVRLSLVAEREALVPGETARLGILFELEPGWHLYWPGRNDTGLPPRVKLDLPDGYRAEDLLWPSPERHVSPGGILDHVYRDELLVILPVRVPETAAPGETARLGVEADWVVCEEFCLFGRDSAGIALPVSKQAGARSEGRTTARFAETRRRLPRAAAEYAGELHLAWQDPTLLVEAPGARRLEFYPATDCGELRDPLADAAVEGPRMALRFDESREDPVLARGLLALFGAGGEGPRYLTLETREASTPPSP
jgi:thiol:disulfide interchange protein DsbD